MKNAPKQTKTRRIRYKRGLQNDTLQIVNGPLDGTAVPLTESPVFIGSSPESTVMVRMDDAVRSRHVRAVPVHEGYRIRAEEKGRVYVDGRKVGRILSRKLRPGDTLQVGQTKFVLTCSPEGMSRRRFGSPLETDFVRLLKSIGLSVTPITGLMRFFLRHWLVTGLLAAFVVYRTVPGFAEFVEEIYRRLRSAL